MKKCSRLLVLSHVQFYIWQKIIHYANYWASVSKRSLIFLMTISCLTDHYYQIMFHLSCTERAGSRKKVMSSTYEFNFSMSPSGYLGQVDFPARQTTFLAPAGPLPTWQRPRQATFQSSPKGQDGVQIFFF